MVLKVNGHKFHYEMENLCRVFFPNENIKTINDEQECPKDNIIVNTILELKNDKKVITVFAKNEEKELKKSYESDKINEDLELKMAQLLYQILLEITGYKPQWGVLTGVRPSKLMTNLIDEMGHQKAKEFFIDSLLVTQKKTDLAVTVANIEHGIINQSKSNSFSLYISIPFCPTRCSYCSFVSHSISSKSARDMIPKYLELLCVELKHTSKIAKDLGLKLETIYIGGGTPSILNSEQIKVLLTEINNDFDTKNIKEFTFEAGRPDTIDESKLLAIKGFPVTRISINPQTFNDEVLEEIGRKHSANETIEAFELARKLGFNDINMDIIAGLPKDNIESFSNTLYELFNLNPESITVHTLALKRSANIGDSKTSRLQGKLTSDMVDMAVEKLKDEKYIPYYMYRQSKSLGNLENVGWCKEGFESYYNVYMMEECHSVFAVGAGAVTKLKSPTGSYIDRIFNFKYPYEYINRFNEILERKDNIYKFYELNN